MPARRGARPARDVAGRGGRAGNRRPRECGPSGDRPRVAILRTGGRALRVAARASRGGGRPPSEGDRIDLRRRSARADGPPREGRAGISDPQRRPGSEARRDRPPSRTGGVCAYDRSGGGRGTRPHPRRRLLRHAHDPPAAAPPADDPRGAGARLAPPPRARVDGGRRPQALQRALARIAHPRAGLSEAQPASPPPHRQRGLEDRERASPRGRLAPAAVEAAGPLAGAPGGAVPREGRARDRHARAHGCRAGAPPRAPAGRHRRPA